LKGKEKEEGWPATSYEKLKTTAGGKSGRSPKKGKADEKPAKETGRN